MITQRSQQFPSRIAVSMARDVLPCGDINGHLPTSLTLGDHDMHLGLAIGLAIGFGLACPTFASACDLESMKGDFICSGSGCTSGAQNSSITKNDNGTFSWTDGNGDKNPITIQNDKVTVWVSSGNKQGQMVGDVRAACQEIKWEYDGHIDKRQ